MAAPGYPLEQAAAPEVARLRRRPEPTRHTHLARVAAQILRRGASTAPRRMRCLSIQTTTPGGYLNEPDTSTSFEPRDNLVFGAKGAPSNEYK